MTRALAIAIVALAACRFTDDPSGTSFDCDQVCPDGFTCAGGHCVAGGSGVDASVIDASLPGDGAVVADAAGGPPDAMVDWCQAAKSRPNADLCGASSPDLTQAARAAGGTTVYGDSTLYQNDLGTISTSCGLLASAGPDAFYKLSAKNGERLYMHLDGTWDTVLYVSGGCTTGSACFVGQDLSGASGEEVTHTFDADADVYLVVDSYTNQGGCFALHVELTGL